jgi:salicylate hydroxylase
MTPLTQYSPCLAFQHLGQGANQALEDIYHLVRCLVKFNPTGESPSTTVLTQAFEEYESIRIERATALVQGARKQGEMRVVSGVDACKARNQVLRDLDTEEGREKQKQGYMFIISGPFTGDPEI